MLPNLIEGISTASQSYNQASANVTSLGDKARQITKTVDTIDKVTIQTNMLAVNGFIEAARAGEYGKGFAVVANDIRSLANESGENADQIKELVNNIQYQVTLVAGDVAESAKAAAGEVTRAKETTKVVEEVGQVLQNLSERFDAIASEVEQIASAIEESSKAIEQINAAAEESSSAIEEASKGADEQARGVEELAKAIEEIAAVADELQSEVGV